MYPWLLLWAPQYHFPWSGSVAQRIDPEAVFGALLPGAGNPRVEREALQQASYGRQLGWLADVLLDVAERQPPTSEEGVRALRELRELRSKIKRLKAA